MKKVHAINIGKINFWMEINKKILSPMCETIRVGKHLIIRLVCQKAMPDKNCKLWNYEIFHTNCW